MTPKEKAEELVNKFAHLFIDDEEEHYIGMILRISKQCALIAVDEILNNFGQLTEGVNFYTGYNAVKFYQEVKQEIKKL